MDGHKDTLLFIDPCCPRPYDPLTIDGPGLGGTEQTIVGLAEGLAKTGLFNVVVEQHNRPQSWDTFGSVKYAGLGITPAARWVVVLRDPRALQDARGRFKDASVYLYSHDLADRSLGLHYAAGTLSKARLDTQICVSSWHRGQTLEVLKAFGFKGEHRLKFIYNPMSEDVVKTTNQHYDKNKLLWLASPHKGLSRAYEIFASLIKANPDFRLFVSNPGYIEDQQPHDAIKSRVTVLGTLPHREVIQHLKDSLCLFYPNTVFPETFGKVLAESNGVGTPVITHPLGAAREVLDSHPDQILDCTSTGAVVERVMKWYGGARPIVQGQPLFKLTNVVKEWVRLLTNVR